MSPKPLSHLSPDAIRHELRGFPERTVEAVLALRDNPGAEHLRTAVLGILTFYLPRGTATDLQTQPSEARLREDLGVDSLTFAEAAYKMEEVFGIRIENADLAELETLGDLLTYAGITVLGGAANPSSP